LVMHDIAKPSCFRTHAPGQIFVSELIP
jgi:hypothetical protein